MQTEAHPAASRNLHRSTKRPWPTPTPPPSICGRGRRCRKSKGHSVHPATAKTKVVVRTEVSGLLTLKNNISTVLSKVRAITLRKSASRAGANHLERALANKQTLDYTSTSFSCDGPMSHWDAMRVTQAFNRDEKAGKGFENITAKRAGNHDGKRDFSTRLGRRGRQPGRGCEDGGDKRERLETEGEGRQRGKRGAKRQRESAPSLLLGSSFLGLSASLAGHSVDHRF